MQPVKYREKIPFHPFLLALYAPLALLAGNILQIRPGDALRSIGVFGLMGAAVYLLLRWRVKDWQRAAMYSSVSLLLFISYGQVLTVLKTVTLLGEIVGRHRYLIPAFLAIGGLAFWGVSRLGKHLKTISNAANILSLALVIFPLYQLAANTVMTAQNESRNAISVSGITVNGHESVTEKPDVYYIILDMYGRDDVLLERFRYDNSEFLAQLEDLGFVVAHCSVTNYNMTELSLASSFNMNYLETLGSQYTGGSKDRSGLPSLIHQSAVRSIFEQMGYRFINFETGFTFTEIRDADEFLVPSYVELENQKNPIRVNAFESLLIKTTAFVILSDVQTKWLTPVADALDTRRVHVVRELYLLDKLPILATEESPKFVYAHILIPHPPFVFTKDGVNLELPSSYGEDGKGPSAKDYSVGYRHQLDYINMRLIPILQQIVRDSKTPPVIILQGDHGVDPKRSLILNAYFLPGQENNPVWQEISPVNTFRVVFNTYFNGKFEILPDINYASKDKAPYDYRSVENNRVCNP
ncbi:MAG: hypothetical protein C0391_02320 [Anaerolinea sp.]|nr:hypothetical protein [Anaerolinea sp.]